MIRSLIAAIAFLSATTAFATPKVGDFASYNVAVEQNGQSANLGLTREITQFNEQTNAYLVRQVITLPDGQTQPSDEWEGSDNFLSDATIDSILANCVASGGTPQTVVVPAGTFSACALNFDNDESVGTAWVAKVTFGLVRLDQISKQDGTKTNINLASFR